MKSSFYMPTKVIIGENCIEANSHLLQGMGTKALIVTGRRSAKLNGSERDVEAALRKEQIDYVRFDQIEENPSLETVEKARDFGKSAGVDFVIGIGGGSPIDAAKAIAVMLKHTKLTGDTLIGKSLDAVPVVAVPTTAGTGTEVTQYAIVTDHKAQTKKNIGHTVFPHIAFLDAKYMMDMPSDITIQTAVDALSHLVESYLNVRSNPMSEVFVEKGLAYWGECVDNLLGGFFTYQSRKDLMMASMYGGMAIAQTGTSLPHGMGYALTYHKGVPHGLANGTLYVEYLRCFKDQAKVQKLHKLIGVKSHEELEKILTALCFTNIQVTESELKQYTEEMCANKAKLQNHPEVIGFEEVYKIYAGSLLLVKDI
ncbi:MAG: iron-containing alcohol dehydrogenase family protein [Niameybacter sp.]|uniref:iron-containing alcohol dehydrogenase family protein n=1 Tax=Niameybacter sp. TaxID=2033640 RepID=UPI002FC6F05E